MLQNRSTFYLGLFNTLDIINFVKSINLYGKL